MALAPVGPSPSTVETKATGDGSLQVFSARQIHDPNYLWDIFVGGINEDSQFDPAHTDYTVYNQEGQVVQKVRNARNLNDDQPAVVSLPPGLYTVKAEASDYGTVTVPVLVKAGQPTVVNLERNGKRSVYLAHKDEYVWLYGYRMVGWKADVAK